MSKAPDAAILVAVILNASWPLRQHFRPWQELERARALRDLGLACRQAFNSCGEDFEPIIFAIADGVAKAQREI